MRSLEELPLAAKPAEVLAWLDGRVGRASLYAEIRRGALRAVKVGRKVLITRQAIAEWLGLPDATERSDGGSALVTAHPEQS